MAPNRTLPDLAGSTLEVLVAAAVRAEALVDEAIAATTAGS